MGNHEKINPFKPLDPVEVGQRLAIIREAKGLNKVQMADKIGTNKSNWGRWEDGERLIGIDYAHRIEQLWRVPKAYTYDGVENDLPGFLREHLDRTRRNA